MQCSTVQSSKVQCSTVQCSRCSAWIARAVQCSTMQWPFPLCSVSEPRHMESERSWSDWSWQCAIYCGQWTVRKNSTAGIYLTETRFNILKHRMQETLNLLTCAGSSTDSIWTETDKKWRKNWWHGHTHKRQTLGLRDCIGPVGRFSENPNRITFSTSSQTDNQSVEPVGFDDINLSVH